MRWGEGRERECVVKEDGERERECVMKEDGEREGVCGEGRWRERGSVW